MFVLLLFFKDDNVHWTNLKSSSLLFKFFKFFIIFPFLWVSSNFDSLDGCLTNLRETASLE